MPNHTPEDIVKLVDKMELDRSATHDRMDADMDRYHLLPYQGELDENGVDKLAGYKHFTANDPATIMNLALHIGSTARRTIRVHEARAQRGQREINNMKELYCLGQLKAVDERRANLIQPSLQDALFAQSYFRGRISERVLLVKEVDEDKEAERQRMIEMGFGEMVSPEPVTRTYADVTDWDPRNTYWRMGKHGLAWACEKSMKSRQQIIDEYGLDPAEGSFTADGVEEDYEKEYAVYDWLDETDNIVVVEGAHSPSGASTGRALKERTPHGMRRVPAVITFAESRPVFQYSQDSGKDYEAHYGESLYRANRGVFNEQNFMYSILGELSHRSINQPLNAFSKDGSLTLEEDPRVSGQITSLSVDNEEDVKPLPPMEMVKEAGVFMGVISSMMQRGSFNTAAYGNIENPLSGFAMTVLNRNVLAPLTVHVTSVKRALKQILDILSDAYATGDFDTMELSGRMQDPQRTYFSQEIQPEMVRAGGEIEVDLLPVLPQDDAARVSLVQMLREGPGGVPLIDDRFAREYLEFQDVDQIERAVWEQLAQRGSPAAVAFNSMMAAAEQGDRELAEIWSQEFQIAMMTKFLEMVQLMMLGGGGGAPGGNGGGAGTPARAGLPRPEAMPPQMIGRNARPNPGAATAGAAGNAGQPRPGAQRGNTFNRDVL